MTLLFALVSLSIAVADDPTIRPASPAPVEGQCKKNVAITRGRVISGDILSPTGKAACSAVAVPLSEYADLLGTEVWAKHLRDRYVIDIVSLERDRDWYKARFDEANAPQPWLERPVTQRWLGRIETLVIVGIATAGLGAAYHYSSGAGK